MENQGVIFSHAAHSEVALDKVFEVFLSFCGKDTRNGFTDFLYTYLKDASIETFRDDNELRVGEKIGPELLKVIRESKISIPVFSRNYVFSKWCLLELAEMVDCHKNEGHMIYPIFYDVASSEVRHQNGSYEKAFLEHEKKFDKETVEGWRDSLRTVGQLKGFELKETNGQEDKLVKMVVEKVLLHLKKNYTILPENLVGIDVHLEILEELLHVGFGRRVVVIHGMGGLGKTTIAKAAFNHLYDRFDNHCFLDDVREKSEHGNGIVDLQNQLISKIKNREFSNIIFDPEEGRDTIKGTVRGRKLILVLDDVDNISQVNMLMGNLSWYGAQSRIIITTRDTVVLHAIETNCQIEGLNDVCASYKPKYMDDHESLQLFSKYAFMRDCPAEGYERLSKEVIGIAAGLPFVLVVLGSTFFAVTDKDFWNEKLRMLRKFPNKKVIDMLRFSFDSLDNRQKQIFLDIACLFIGEDVTMPTYMWDDCGFYPRHGINVLVRKSLITVNEDNEFEMHDQLRDLGRQIVREESLNDLGKQSRFWRREDAMHILETNQGTASVNALRLPYSLGTAVSDLDPSESESPVLAYSFNNIPNLRYLDMGDKCLDGDFKDLLLGLRWLTISTFREDSATNLYLKHLVILNLARNDFIEDLRDFKIGEKLKVLELSKCHSVRVLSDLSKHPSLEILSLSHCDSLCAIDGLEKLKSLKCLKAYWCPSLEELCLSDLTNLSKLDLEGCDQLTEIQGLEKLDSLQELHISRCPSLKEVPDLSNLKRLEKIEVNSTKNFIKIKGLIKVESLRCLKINSCECVEMFPDFSNLKMLEYIEVHRCEQLIEIKGLDKLQLLRGLNIRYCGSLESLPDFSNLKMLENICVDGCSKLIEIKGLEKLVLIKDLCLQNCESLERLPDLLNINALKKIDVKGCVKLVEIEGLEKLESLENLCMEYCRSLRRLPNLSNLKKLKTFNVGGCVKLVEIEGLEKLEMLEDLCLENCSSLERLPDLSNLKKLKKLTANGCTRLAEIKGLDKLESLRFLQLGGCGSLKGTICIPNLDEFEVFDVPTLELTNFDFLKKLKELEITLKDNMLTFQGLNVNNLYMYGESMIRLLIDEFQGLFGLESLVRMVIHTYREVSKIQALDRLEFLKLLDINYCSHFKRVLNLPNFGRLKGIELISCDELDDVEGIGVIESLESLVIIRCYKIRQIPDLRKLKSLKSLYLDDLNLISIHGLDKLKSLEDLCICRCTLIETLPDLSNLVKLTALNASGCPRLIEIQGLEKMKSLTSLNIKECNSIVALPDFSDLEKLVELDASGCVRLSKIIGLEELASLEWLNIYGCESIEALPDLSIRSLLGLPNTIVQRTQNIYDDTENLGPSYETSETSTNELRFSLYALENTEKQIFLDIACLFIGEDVTRPSYMWEDCRFYPIDGINALVRKSLITVDEHNRLGMHDQLRDLGWQIVREEMNELGKRSRLWRKEEAMQILETNQGTKHVEALYLDFAAEDLEFHPNRLVGDDFVNLPNMRFLVLGCVDLDGNFEQLFTNIKWLKWAPTGSFSPINLCVENLVILDLSYSKITDDWKGWSQIKMAKHLKVLDLSHCYSLSTTSHFSLFVTLEQLILSSCFGLSEIDQSLGNLINLRLLDLSNCMVLQGILDSENFAYLESLDVACTDLRYLHGFKELKSLRSLNTSGCRFISTLSGISNLKMLSKLNTSVCVSLSEIQGLEKLKCLRHLNMKGCLTMERIPNISELVLLEEVNIAKCVKLREVDSLKNLKNLVTLDLSFCTSLQSIPKFSNFRHLKKLRICGLKSFKYILRFGVLKSLEVLDVTECKSIRILPLMGGLKHLKEIYACRCVELVEVIGLEKVSSLEVLDISGCVSIERLPDLSNLKRLGTLKASGCVKLSEIRGLDELSFLELDVRGCELLRDIP